MEEWSCWRISWLNMALWCFPCSHNSLSLWNNHTPCYFCPALEVRYIAFLRCRDVIGTNEEFIKNAKRKSSGKGIGHRYVAFIEGIPGRCTQEDSEVWSKRMGCIQVAGLLMVHEHCSLSWQIIRCYISHKAAQEVLWHTVLNMLCRVMFDKEYDL